MLNAIGGASPRLERSEPWAGFCAKCHSPPFDRVGSPSQKASRLPERPDPWRRFQPGIGIGRAVDKNRYDTVYAYARSASLKKHYGRRRRGASGAEPAHVRGVGPWVFPRLCSRMPNTLTPSA